MTASNEATSQMPGRSALRAPVAARKDESSTAGSMAGVPIETTSVPPRRTVPFAIGMGVGATILFALILVLSRGADLTSAGPASSASASPDGTAPGGADHRANVVILPDDALVEIDGAATTPVDGIVKIVGAIGSTHRVRVSKDKQEKIADVVIGSSGAEPPKVELVLAAVPAAPTASAKPIGGRGGPLTKKSATPATPAPTPKNPLIPERFE